METQAQFITREEYEAQSEELTERTYEDPMEYSETAVECRELSEMAVQGNGVSRINVPREVKRQRVVNAFQDAFELIGGVPRLAHWADQHPSDFFKLYARLLPVEASQRITHDGGITINHVLPRGPLDKDIEHG